VLFVVKNPPYPVSERIFDAVDIISVMDKVPDWVSAQVISNCKVAGSLLNGAAFFQIVVCPAAMAFCDPGAV